MSPLVILTYAPFAVAAFLGYKGRWGWAAAFVALGFVLPSLSRGQLGFLNTKTSTDSVATTTLPVTDISVTVDKNLTPLNLSPVLSTGLGGKKVF